MNRIIFATGNAGKMVEVREILAGVDAEILSMKEAGIKADIVEDGSTFEENALIKARAIHAQCGCLVLADDSGLEGSARSARFRCVIAAVFPDGTEAVTEGTIEGEIAHAPSGRGGFGYDPIFYLPEKGKTTADLTAEEKNAISHRGIALSRMKPLIQKWCEENKG